MPLTNQDKREMLEMIADAVTDTHVVTHAENSLMSCLSIAIKAKAASLPEDKPERKMPENGEKYISVQVSEDFKNPFELIESRWENHTIDIRRWKNGRAFLLSERALAEKKCAELNEILRR